MEVFCRSCNTALAEMAVNIGAPTMVATAEAFGFNNAPPFDLPRPAESVFGTVEDFVDNIPLLAIAGFGQGNTQATPLEMALVASAVANGGEIMTPHVVDRTVSREGQTLTRTQPEVWRRAMQPATATTMTGLMIEVVNNGTARCCMQLAGGIQAAAKTGTAQLNPKGQPPASTDHRVRARRSAPVRDRSDGQGNARGDRRHGRHGRRSHRPAGAERRCASRTRRRDPSPPTGDPVHSRPSLTFTRHVTG